MPARCCLAMHGPLHESALRLRDGEFVVAYLDDIYLPTPRDRAREAYDIVTETVWRRAGVSPNASLQEGMLGQRWRVSAERCPGVGRTGWGPGVERQPPTERVRC